MKKSQSPSVTDQVTGKILDLAIDLVTRVASDDGSATTLLRRQHASVKSLFGQLEKATSARAKAKLFETLARSLVAHDAIEREIFYPACERAMGMTDLLGEALVEHGVVEFCLHQADLARKHADFGFKCQVLSEVVLHHVREEEREFFPKVEKALGQKELVRLAALMRARFAAVSAQDFREPLSNHLQQVIAGTLKPAKRAPRSKKRPTTVANRTGRRRRAA
jgi:hypothetical protein